MGILARSESVSFMSNATAAAKYGKGKVVKWAVGNDDNKTKEGEEVFKREEGR